MADTTVAPKPRKSLADVSAAAESIMEQMESVQEGAGDPFAIAAPRPGETTALGSQTTEELTTGAGEAPLVDANEPPPIIATSAVNAAPDPWSDYEEVTYADDDTGESFTVRAPKAYAGKVKDGYARRSVMDRNSRYLASARPILEPIITSGQFGTIQPLLDRALNDPEYAQAIGELYQRRVTGQPLTVTQERKLDQALTQVQQQAVAEAPNPELDEAYNDPYVRAIGAMVDRAIDAKLSPFQQELQRTHQYEQQRQQQEQQENYARAEANRVQRELLNEMRAMYPADFGGTDQEDAGKLARLFNYAVQSRYITDYNPNTVKLGVRLAYRELGTTTAPSPAVAAQSAAQVEADARARAAQMVGGRTSGGGVTAAAPVQNESDKLRSIKSRRPDGTMKKPQEIAAQVARVLENR
jgi:hypothetical protein